LGRVEIDTDEFADSFAGHGFHDPLMRLVMLVDLIDEHDARGLRPVEFEMGIGKGVSAPEEEQRGSGVDVTLHRSVRDFVGATPHR
jgi:hypothetical protein